MYDILCFAAVQLRAFLSWNVALSGLIFCHLRYVTT